MAAWPAPDTWMTLTQLISAVRADPALPQQRYTLTYYKRVKQDDADDAGSAHAHAHAHVRFGVEELPDFVRSITLPDGVHLIGDLVCRLARSREEAAHETACNAAVFHALHSASLVRRLTHLPDVAKGLHVEHPLQPRDIVFYRSFDGDLPQLLQRHGRLSTVQALRMLTACCMLLERLHAHGLVHGGVQPTSVLYSAGGFGGIKFALSHYAGLRTVRDGKSAGVEARELYARVDPLDRDLLRDGGRPEISASHAAKKKLLYSAAQLDLLPLGLMVARLLRGGHVQEDDPRVGSLLRGVQDICMRSDADFSTLRGEVLPIIQRVLESPSYYRDPTKWAREFRAEQEAQEEGNSVEKFVHSMGRLANRV